MPRGGYRPGAGRPKGARSAPKETRLPPPDVARAARNAAMTPLDYMLAVMRDAGADDARRDRMAIAAAPYCHARAADTAPGKTARAAQAAQTAGRGTDWEHLLA